MLDIEGDILGFDEIQQILDTFQPKVEKRVLKRSLTKGALVIKKIAKANAPSGRTGNLRKSIKHRTGRAPIVQVYAQGGRDSKNDGWYAHIIERGSVPHSLRKGALSKSGYMQNQTPKHPGNRATYFMEYSLTKGFNAAVDAVNKESSRLIYKEVWGK